MTTTSTTLTPESPPAVASVPTESTAVQPQQDDEEMAVALGASVPSGDDDHIENDDDYATASLEVDSGGGELDFKPAAAATTALPLRKASSSFGCHSHNSMRSLPMVEEGREMEMDMDSSRTGTITWSPRWSCPPSCPLATTGHHGLGCTKVHEYYDVFRGEMTKVPRLKDGDDTTNREEDDLTGTNRSLDDSSQRHGVLFQYYFKPSKVNLTTAQLLELEKRAKYRRKAACYMLVTLFVGTICLLLILVVPSAMSGPNDSDSGDENITNEDPDDMEALWTAGDP